MALPALPVKGL